MMVFLLYLKPLCLLIVHNYFAVFQGKYCLISLTCRIYKKKSQCIETRNRMIVLMLRDKGKQKDMDQTEYFSLF